MTYDLATDSYEWLTEEELLSFDIYNSAPGVSYILEVDLHYPSNIHHDHNDLPMAVEKRHLGLEDLSKQQKEQYKCMQGKLKHTFSQQRLCLTLYDKKKLVVYVKNLR